MNGMKKYKVVAAAVSSFWLFVFLGLPIILRVVSPVCKRGEPIIATRVALKYDDENVVFYLPKIEKAHDLIHEFFMISDEEGCVWAIESVGPVLTLPIDPFQSFPHSKLPPRLVYGEIPDGYGVGRLGREECPARELELNREYRVHRSLGASRGEPVTFKLVLCGTAPDGICLETNSPVTERIKTAVEQGLN